MWGVGVVSESDCVIWMVGGLMEEEVGLGGSGRDGSTEEEAGCAVLSSGEWNINVPIVLRWNVAGRLGLSWWGLPVLKENVWSNEYEELRWLSE